MLVIKRKPDGSIDKYKARLVAQGCSQNYNIDYRETYAGVVRHSTIRIVLALAIQHKLFLWQRIQCYTNEANISILNINDKYNDGSFDVKYVPSEQNSADIFTKVLPKQ